MNIAAIIVGIDGWEEYTLPLIESIREHEPSCAIAVVDNASQDPYPFMWGGHCNGAALLQRGDKQG